MDEATLINDTWDQLQRLSEADRTTRSYNFWARVNGEKGGLLTVTCAMLETALRQAMQENEIAEYLTFLKNLDAKAEERRRVEAIVALYADPEERTADW